MFYFYICAYIRPIEPSGVHKHALEVLCCFKLAVYCISYMALFQQRAKRAGCKQRATHFFFQNRKCSNHGPCYSFSTGRRHWLFGTHHADELSQRHHQLHCDQLGAIGGWPDQLVVVGRVQEMLHQALLRVCPQASCNENSSSSPPSSSSPSPSSSAPIVRNRKSRPSGFIFRMLLFFFFRFFFPPKVEK